MDSPTAYAHLPTLKRGAKNQRVKDVKAILRSQGFWTGSDSDDFGPMLAGAVQHFQSTHLGPRGVYLQGDGEVGEQTWWALHNPTGVAQRSGLHVDLAKVPERWRTLSASRQILLSELAREHAKGVQEIPDGSNGGDGVDKYIAGFGRAPWCCLLVSWAWKTNTGSYPLGQRYAHVQTFWQAALAAGVAHHKFSREPVPGDHAVWRYDNGQGHISTVAAVSADGLKINTYGGNESNRLKLGVRDLRNEPRLVGYINLHDDAERTQTFERGLIGDSEQILANASTR